jgi:TraM recognition site of TraD and TraG
MFSFRRSRRPGDLDHVLMPWSPVDFWTVRHACTNLAGFGKSGSGKSSGSGDAVLRALVRYWNSGGLILASKPEDKAYVMRVFREERTLDDLLIMEPGGEYRFNLLAYEQKRGADARQLTQLLMVLAETLDRMEGGGSQGGEPIWKAKNREALDHANEIIIRAGQLDPWALQCFISSAALSLEEVESEQWKQSYHWKMLELARQNAHTDLQKHDHEAARQHWLENWPRMNDRTRTSIEAGLMSILHVFNTGTVRDLLATSTNISPDKLEQRKWWLVNLPIVPGDATATFVNTAVKLAVQRYILGRQAGEGDPLLCIYCDEFTKVANSYDSHTLNEIRSHKGCMVTLTQSISGMYAHMHGQGGEHMTDALLSQYGHIVFHTSDAKTARFASEMLGQRLEMMKGGSPRQPQDSYDVFMGRSHFMPSFNYAYEPILQPLAFMSGLRSGGMDNDNTVDGIVIRPGMPFNASRENYLLASFKQR